MIKRIIKFFLLRCKFRKKVDISFTANCTLKSQFEGMCKLHPHSEFHGSLGLGSYIGKYSILSAEIGRFTSIGNNVVCNAGIHPYVLPFVTTSPCFFSLNISHAQCGSTFATQQQFDEQRLVDPQNEIAIKIGNDVWIGEGAFIVGGIIVGDGAVVLAHSVVTKDIPPYAIVGGVPAKILRYRYDTDTIAFLLKIKWWNNSVKWFRKNWLLLSDMERLKEYYKRECLIQKFNI